MSWTAATSGDYFVADCGPYTGPWPGWSAPVQDLPSDSQEVDLLITEAPLSAFIDESVWADWQYADLFVDLFSGRYQRKAYIQAGTNGTPFDQYSSSLPSGIHIYAVWYAPSYALVTTPPSYDALTLVPTGYASGASADYLMSPHGTLSDYAALPSGVVVDSGTYTTGPTTTTYPFGNPAIGVLGDKTIIVVAPYFSAAHQNDVWLRAWHLDTDLSVLGHLDLFGYTTTGGATLDTWGGFAGCTGVVNGDPARSTEFLVVAFNRRTSTAARVHSWVLDCSTLTPTVPDWPSLPGTPRYDASLTANSNSVNSVATQHLNTSGGDALILHNSVSGGQASIFSFDTAQHAYAVALSGLDGGVLAAFHADPSNPDNYAALDQSGHVVRFHDVPGSGFFVVDSSGSVPYSYWPQGGGNPYVSGAVDLDIEGSDYDHYRYADINPLSGTARNITALDFGGAGVSMQVGGSGTARLASDRFAVIAELQEANTPAAPGPPYFPSFVRCWIVDHNSGVSVQTIDLAYPSSLVDATTISTNNGGSHAVDSADSRIAVASNIFDNYGAGPSYYPTLVVWVIDGSAGFQGWGVPM